MNIFINLFNKKKLLTPMEINILILLAQGCTVRYIYSHLHISKDNLYARLSTIRTKLNAVNQINAVYLALKQGII